MCTGRLSNTDVKRRVGKPDILCNRTWPTEVSGLFVEVSRKSEKAMLVGQLERFRGWLFT